MLSFQVGSNYEEHTLPTDFSALFEALGNIKSRVRYVSLTHVTKF